MRIWRAVQWAVWAAGAALLVALVVAPAIGIHAFWNVLIPVAPALLVVAPGLWRNVCPLGTTALLPPRAGRRLSPKSQARLHWIGIALLLGIVPLRHVWLNTNGPATAITLAALAAVAVVMGFAFETKSGWCSTMCPVHPVERLYGASPLLAVPNARCAPCVQCVAPCPDSVAGAPTRTLIVGGFAGFVWGWFHVPDGASFGASYAWPLGAMAVTLAAYLALRRVPRIDRVFAAAAVSTYYWYRLPALFGFGLFPGDGMLVDLRGSLPEAAVVAMQVVPAIFFFWWLAIRPRRARSWCPRPAMVGA